MPKELSSKKEDNKGGGGRLRKRVKSKYDNDNDNNDKDREMVDDETLESSGYSSGEKDGTNVIYYKVQISSVCEEIKFLGLNFQWALRTIDF